MKRRPHKIVSVILLVVLIAGMGMACRIQSLESRNKGGQRIRRQPERF